MPENTEEQMEITEGLRLDAPVESDESTVEKDAPVETPVEKDEELTPEALAGEQETPVEESTEEQIVPYTPEEVEALLKEEDANVDFRRLTPEGQAIFKSVDRGLKPKLEERKELQRRLAEVERTVGAKEPAQNTVEQEFEKNPQGVLANIRQMIAEKERMLFEKRQTDPFGVEVDQFGNEIAQLRNVHSHFIEKLAIGQYEERQKAEIRTAAYQTVRESVPDFDTKAEDVTVYAVEQLGIPNEKLLEYTDAAIVGPEAAALTVQVLTRLYDAEKQLAEVSQGKSVEGKVVKTPTQVEGAGAGFQEKPTTEWSVERQIAESMKQTLD